ncbi:n19m, NADH-ubiquinone oxidoreductase 9.5 kDa subunit [Coemansia javaensis]|uniref:N19m, NADH-ubiquinone oxidoreductase 9.5 kDa subunit n=1 Tax=Coemansia javaensis TaxID=2761396 RepID=A0A9W8H720_9FUNG|nr:n19m, NADH-ubiquinone oxidoreductase 9.5 kDa subunit [Coemansia javaensis]
MSIISAVRKAAFEHPFAVWGLALGFAGPILVVTVPPVMRRFGYNGHKAIPQSYPLPNRARRPTHGFED